ncbi:MAG: M14 family metallopeptidase, partial [Bacteroidota bacterium]
MIRSLLVVTLLSFPTFLSAQNTIQNPEEFLGYKLGERFTRHHKVIEYYKYIAGEVPHVNLVKYGETYEHRPLMAAIISSPENMAKLDEIKTNNLKRTRLLEGTPSNDKTAIVWLSYNVHGNEASTIEASMETLYSLVDPSNNRSKEWLKNTVVIMDPCINPDGRDRYANFYNQYGNKDFNPDGNDLEHHEVWPGGRANHYLFDLNRDWAWQTQVESESRLKLYHKWMPHIHVDFHEQGYNSPYYFAPATEPYHEVISQWQRDFQVTIGRNHAKYFDQNNWLYFTDEVFDLLYPSYGDTYPTFNGAIGMTYEQAGGGYGGLGVLTEYKDTLTLKDRVAHHHTTGISTIEISSQHATRLVDEFAKSFEKSVNNPSAKYKSYVIKSSSGKDKIKSLISLLEKHHIQYGTASRKSVNGFSYKNNGNRSVSVNSSDLAISVYQPKAKLITSLFEPVAKLSDSLTYDITAWSLPYAYGLDAYAVQEKLTVTEGYEVGTQYKVPSNGRPYAYIAKYNSLEDARWLARLLKEGVNVRVAKKPFTIEGQSFKRGSLVVTRRNNENLREKFDKIILETSKDYSRPITAVATGFSDTGVDLGSSSISRLAVPKIAVLAGPQTSSLSFGEIWHFFERQINYPITKISTDYFKSVDLWDYNVLIVPHGYYQIFNESLIGTITRWVKDGGKLILIGNALNSFKNKKGFNLKDGKKANGQANKKNTSIEDQLKSYDSQERDRLSSSIFGAIFKVRVDNSHPLAYGYDQHYFSLKTSSLQFPYLQEGSNVGV